MNKRVTAVVIGLLVVLVAAQVFSAAASKIRWNFNFNKAAKGAQKANKPMMVDFYTDWCGWCKRLDQTTYKDQQVVKLSRSFVCVKINAEKHSDLAKKYKIEGYPTIVFLNSKTNEISRVVGYQDAKMFLASMKAALKKAK